MTVLGIDPGPTQSAFVLYDGTRILGQAIEPNEDLLKRIEGYAALSKVGHCVIERIASFGMPVGEEVFETVFWSGQFADRWRSSHVRLGLVSFAARIRRIDIKSHLCHNARANDTHIRQALIDRFGGKDQAIGKKATPGPLYHIHADMWAALSVAVTHYDSLSKEN